ncbi:PfkB family carbohydrate kinase [Planococcus salinus]|uniref:Winged helix-turn-helix transcriptional regulator n=1 Tax=Planococcus salinus TaxID=1848460 RepID=A0A3M8P498_9BACL|nr:PfkB family carbohydrate kinase [Planococcus salinus]RNF38462.1 winged helix-turn-helix transcriptional regulator [Planococcus salinus]
MNRKESEVLEMIRKNPFLSQQEMADALEMSRPALANLISSLIRQGKIVGRAYVLPEADTVVCIGGANVDRKFRMEKPAQMGTSNPASVAGSVGGVARNIAENLGRLGHSVRLMSIAGVDSEWKMIEEASAPFMDTELTQTVDGCSTGSYTAILQPDGEMILAMADMAIYDLLTPDYVARQEKALMSAGFLVMDLNCPKETVEYVRAFAKARQIPLAVIPVSAPKMERLGKELDGITWLILNRDEAEQHLNFSIKSEADWQKAVERLLDSGVENVVVTNGKEGVMAGNAQGITHYKAISISAVEDVTGAGDAFSSGLVHGILLGKEFLDIVHFGLVNAARTLQSQATVRPELTAIQLQKDREELL